MPASTAVSAQGTKFQIAGTPGSAITITAITKAADAVVTATNTLAVGDVVVFGSVTGMPEIAGRVGVVITASGTSFTVDIDSSGFATAGTSGTATPYSAATGWTTVGNVKSYDGFTGTKSEIDVSHMLSDAKEYVPGLEDFGSFTGECDLDPADAGQIALRANKSSNAATYFRLALTNGKVRAWKGFVKKFSEGGGVDAVYKCSFEVRITGPVAAS